VATTWRMLNFVAREHGGVCVARGVSVTGGDWRRQPHLGGAGTAYHHAKHIVTGIFIWRQIINDAISAASIIDGVLA